MTKSLTEKQLITQFSKEMYSKLVKRRKRYGKWGWRKRKIRTLRNWLNKEMQELQSELQQEKSKGQYKKAQQECLDVALLAMMIYDKLKNK